MIVYNVKRRWFAEKAAAEQYRVAERLRPSTTLKVSVEDRNALVSLLEALCSPPPPGQAVSPPATPELIDRAFVSGSIDIPDCVPDFLLKDHGLKR
jgi:hypothetical protein